MPTTTISATTIPSPASNPTSFLPKSMKHTKTEFKADQVYVSHPYVVTFSGEATNIYEIESSGLQHITSLSEPVTDYLPQNSVIVDPSRDALIIAGKRVYAFNLHDGQLQNTIGLFGTSHGPTIYDRGRVLVTLSDDTEEDEEECWILACNPFDLEPAGYSFLTEIRVARTETFMHYHLVHSSAEYGVVVGQHTSKTQQPLILHYWSPEGQPYDDSLPPIYTVEIPMTLECAESIIADYAASIDDDCFALATLETVLGSPDAPGTHQTVVRTHQLPTLETLWESQPVDGRLIHFYHLPAEGIILAIGSLVEWEDSSNPDNIGYGTWILALDVENGERKQFAKLNHRKIGKELVECDITTCVAEDGEIIVSEDPNLVFISSVGDIATLPFSKFLDEGLSSDTFSRLHETCHSSGLQLKDIPRLTVTKRASVGDGSAAVLDDDGFLSIFTW
ncbi:hypothetical protein E1B28_002471 [Marasmius oreades]|uniref:Uncharacterized protein n=1 Tax=Marasmius oreades TaxID=181124 RepID=A0A9P7RMQ2_9AGAR|nr:uncharacterized protein E1B28_002471 [Marasmius oreades]KAG7086519.1 hypothetical protein E1B28_002471 [Marasmius oreades]